MPARLPRRPILFPIHRRLCRPLLQRDLSASISSPSTFSASFLKSALPFLSGDVPHVGLILQTQLDERQRPNDTRAASSAGRGSRTRCCSDCCSTSLTTPVRRISSCACVRACVCLHGSVLTAAPRLGLERRPCRPPLALALEQLLRGGEAPLVGAVVIVRARVARVAARRRVSETDVVMVTHGQHTLG